MEENLNFLEDPARGKIFASSVIDYLSYEEDAYGASLEDLQEQMKMLVTLCRFNSATIEVIYVFNKLGDIPITDFYSCHLTEKYDYSGIFTKVRYSNTLKQGYYVYIQHEAGKQLIPYTARKNSMNSFGEIGNIQAG